MLYMIKFTEICNKKTAATWFMAGTTLVLITTVAILLIPNAADFLAENPNMLTGILLSVLGPYVAAFLLSLLTKQIKNKSLRRISYLLLSGTILAAHLWIASETIIPSAFFRPAHDAEAAMRLRNDRTITELRISTEHGELRGFEKEGSTATLLYFGGSGASSSEWIETVMSHQELRSFRILTVDYPGFGESDGNATEDTACEGGTALYDYAKHRYPNEPVILIGYSLGTGVASFVSNVRTIDGMVLVAPFYDAPSMFTETGSLMHSLMQVLSSVRFPNHEYAAEFHITPLIVCGNEDHVTPLYETELLMEAYPSSPILKTIPACGHADYWEKQDTYDAISEYLSDLVL